MGDQLQLAADREIGEGRTVQVAGGQFPLDRDHRQKGCTKAALHRVFDGLKRVELHLNLQARHVQTRARQQLVDHLAGRGLGIQGDKAQPVQVVLTQLRQAGQGVLGGQHQGQLIAGVGNDLQQLVELTR